MDCNTLKDILEILSKYIDLNNEFIESGHDIVWLCDAGFKISEEDKNKLENMGLFIDDESWYFNT